MILAGSRGSWRNNRKSLAHEILMITVTALVARV